MNIVITPNSRKSGNKWIPEGMVSFVNGPNITERKEYFENTKFDTEEEVNQYFMQVLHKKYKIKDR